MLVVVVAVLILYILQSYTSLTYHYFENCGWTLTVDLRRKKGEEEEEEISCFHIVQVPESPNYLSAATRSVFLFQRLLSLSLSTKVASFFLPQICSIAANSLPQDRDFL